SPARCVIGWYHRRASQEALQETAVLVLGRLRLKHHLVTVFDAVLRMLGEYGGDTVGGPPYVSRCWVGDFSGSREREPREKRGLPGERWMRRIIDRRAGEVEAER